MNWQDPKILLGGGAVVMAIAYYYYKAPASDSGEGDGLGPALISYVSPGSKDANIDDTGSFTGTGGSNVNDALTSVSTHSDDTTLSIYNTDALLSRTTDLVSSQLKALPFKSDYGFSSNVTGGIQLSAAGAPQFTFTSSVTPQDPSTATSQIAYLNKKLTASNTKITAQNKTIATLRSGASNTRTTTTRPTVTPTGGGFFGPARGFGPPRP